ncbi:UNC93-like protein MFSD11 isoform X2 [Puntigrus tetrazona]|uniref:UNC93-like protein MFSD11 isoform X2 n=1 Tax=Puntigrus tetrazona TaxID=1606681 RepID=UPI001C893232|nr:UNC93-like protein MFSD11 isoform X2 [Puntigrus tetrazona]
MSPEGKTLLNVIILGLGFMVMFTAFGTCGNIEQTVIKSFNSTEFHGSGYTSMAIIYAVFSASNLIAPSVIAVIGPQLSLFFSGLVYSGYIAVFIHPYTSSFYTLSVLLGIAAAVLWTAQGNLLTINSKDSTIGRNSGIFWALMQFSLFFGNLYIFVAWRGKSHITDKDRQTVFITLTVISLVGNFLFFLIQRPDPEPAPSDASESLLPADISDSGSVAPSQSLCSQALQAFKKSIQLAMTKEMLLLSVPFAYSGVELTFYSGVYGTCLGAMTQFGDNAKGLIGLSGILIGVGEILASDAPVAPEEGTQMQAFIQPSVTVALICSFLLGLGDSCFNTQLISIVGFLFREDSAPAFAVFKFVQSITAAVAFFYSNYLLLHWQLLIMVLSGFLGTITFFVVEWGVISSRRDSDYDSI